MAAAKSWFLVKTEPETFAFADLVRAGQSIWDGVSNPAALIHLRKIRKGDEIFIYHTGSEKAVVGLAVATSAPFEDPKKPGQNDRGEPKFAVVSLAPVRAFATPVTLAAIKADARFAAFPLVTQGRLSVMPVPAALAKALIALGK